MKIFHSFKHTSLRWQKHSKTHEPPVWHHDTQHNNNWHDVILSHIFIFMLNVIMLSITFFVMLSSDIMPNVAQFVG
jgi:hypothetical protein